jgi:hypothetical protein
MPPEDRQVYERAMASAGGPEVTHRFTNIDKIIIDGKEYARAEEMPPDVRQSYEEMLKCIDDSNENQKATTSTQIFFDGQKYSSVEQMPPSIRRSYEQMRATMTEAIENPEVAEVTEIIVNDKKFASVEEMPPDLRRTYLQAIAASGEIAGNSLKTVRSGLPARQRTITIIEEHSGKEKNAEVDVEKPGLGWFLAILAGITVMYLMYLLIPGRHEPWAKFIARQPTWGSFFRGWTFFVLPVSSFLWLGIYLFRGRFFDALSLALKIFMAVLILLIIAMTLSVFGW